MDPRWIFTPFKKYEPDAQQSPAKHYDLQIAASIFNDTLRDLDPNLPKALIGLFGNAGKLLQVWAEKYGANILASPDVELLLNGSADLWPELHNNNVLLSGDIAKPVFIITDLERCFLRHTKGISLVRKLVETTWGKPCRLIIGCDAWSWKYLQQAVQIDTVFQDVFTAAPLMAYPPAEPTNINIAPRDKDLRPQAYVLHTLLAHNGVSASILSKLLPLRATEIFKILTGLREQQIAFIEDGMWRVAKQHYAAIRKELQEAEFWVSEK
jgi:hypothetical protein